MLSADNMLSDNVKLSADNMFSTYNMLAFVICMLSDYMLSAKNTTFLGNVLSADKFSGKLYTLPSGIQEHKI
jgi:hypothetical protein